MCLGRAICAWSRRSDQSRTSSVQLERTSVHLTSSQHPPLDPRLRQLHQPLDTTHRNWMYDGRPARDIDKGCPRGQTERPSHKGRAIFYLHPPEVLLMLLIPLRCSDNGPYEHKKVRAQIPIRPRSLWRSTP